MFVKKETVTETINVIKYQQDARLPNFASISIMESDGDSEIRLVVGADWEDACACYFEKKSLKFLIDTLQEVHDAMKSS